MGWLGNLLSRKQAPVRRRGAATSTVQYATSPLLAAKTPLWRSKLIVAGLGLGSLVLVGRAAFVQIIDADFYLKQGESRYMRKLDLPASRGRVFDRNGQILAASVPAPSLWALPKDFEATPSQQRDLAKLLGYTQSELKARLAENANFVWLRRQVDESLAKKVKDLGIKGIYELTEYKRRYPEGEAVAHVVGFTSVEQKGLEGVELAFQNQLAGREGTRSVIRDRLGRIVEDIGDSRPPVDGHDLELSIDSKIQFFAYQRVRDAVVQHRARSGSAVVLDTQTGEILAMANYPSYVPGDIQPGQADHIRNRALTDTFEPGSTMKPFIVSIALDTGRVKPTTVLPTAGGRIYISGLPISDDHPHGDLTVEQVVQKSSNVGTVRMAMQMQPREMWEMYRSVGFGQKPDLPFPGMATGRLRPYKTWRPIEQATMSYGYGLSVSLVQLAHAYTSIAHDGELMPLSLLKRDAPPAGARVMTAQTAREIRHMLQMVVSEGGTAPKAQALGYSVGGKTGTAYKQEGKGYAEKKYRSWFVGIAPINNPRIVVAVMVDEPSDGKYFGGDVAAPVFSELVQQTLRMMNVPPDLDVKPQVVARAHEAVGERESF